MIIDILPYKRPCCLSRKKTPPSQSHLSYPSRPESGHLCSKSKNTATGDSTHSPQRRKYCSAFPDSASISIHTTFGWHDYRSYRSLTGVRHEDVWRCCAEARNYVREASAVSRASTRPWEQLRFFNGKKIKVSLLNLPMWPLNKYPITPE